LLSAAQEDAMFRRLIAQLFKNQTVAHPSNRRAKPRTRATLAVTPLEDRTVPTVLTISAASSTLTEATGSPTPVQVTVTRDNTSGGLAYSFSLSGTATNGSDYSAPATGFFAPGSATSTFFVGAINDSTSEATETATIAIASGAGYTVGTPGSVTFDILDNDAQVVTVAKIGDTTEGIAGAYQFTRIGDLSSSLTANFSVSGTATSGTDFTALGTTVTFNAGSNIANLSLAPLADNSVESSETVVVTATSGTGYTVGSPSAATITISDDPPVISISGDSVSEASSAGGFLLARSGGNLSSALTVTYSVSGTATSGTDYTTLSGSVTFEADAENAFVGFNTIGDNTADDDETIVATLTGAGSTYTIDSLADDATITVADQTLTVWVERLGDGTEGGSNGTFRFWRGGDITASQTVNYTVGGTATSGTDYTALSGSVTFAANSDHTDVSVSVTNDATVESTETVTVTLDSSDDYRLSNDSETLFLYDNDTTKVYWVSGSATGYSTDWGTAANWSTNSLPTSTDEVHFDSAHSNVSCTNFGSGASSRMFAGLHLGTGYSGTVTLAVPVTVSTFEQTSGTLNEPSGTYGSDLTVTKAMTWTGGTLNSTSHLATVTITGSTAVALFAPTSGGTVSLGSNITLDDGANAAMKAGTIDLTNDSAEFTVSTNCLFGVDPGAGLLSAIGKATGLFSISNQANAEMEIRSGVFQAKGKITNAGSFRVLAEAVVMVKGVAATDLAYRQTGGGTYLHGGSSFFTATGKQVKIEGGILATVSSDGFTTGGCSTLISTDKLEISGGDIYINYGLAAHLTYGTIVVQGDVLWTGGTYHPYVEGHVDLGKSDHWSASGGSFTIGGPGATAALDPRPIDAECSITTPTSGYEWALLGGSKGVFALSEHPTRDTDVWTFNYVGDVRTTAWLLKAK
jgi:Calx-beta domain